MRSAPAACSSGRAIAGSQTKASRSSFVAAYTGAGMLRAEAPNRRARRSVASCALTPSADRERLPVTDTNVHPTGRGSTMLSATSPMVRLMPIATTIPSRSTRWR